MKKVDDLTPPEFTLPPLHQAARQRDIDKTRQLLDQGLDVNAKDPVLESGDGGNTSLWYAAQGLPTGGVAIAKLLVAAGADINEPGEFNMTALHIACSWGHADMVKFLHAHGADLYAVDHYGRTPAMLTRADYAEGLTTPPEKRLAGWDGWLKGMEKITLYFNEIKEADGQKAVNSHHSREP